MPTQPYKTTAGERVPGVTTVLGAQLAWNKGALMYWALGVAWDTTDE